MYTSGGGGTDSFGLGTDWNLPPSILGFWLLLFCHLSITTPHFCNISEPLPKMGTCNIEIVPETLDNEGLSIFCL